MNRTLQIKLGIIVVATLWALWSLWPTIKLAQGTESVVDVYIDDHPGTSREEAVKALLEIQTEKRLLEAGMTPPPTGGE